VTSTAVLGTCFAQDLDRTINEQADERRHVKCFEKSHDVSGVPRVLAVRNVPGSKFPCSTGQGRSMSGLRLP